MLLLVGQMVERVFRELERENPKCTVTWFAGQLNCDRRNVYDIFKRATIDTQLLIQISLILNHNFYEDLAEAVETERKRRKLGAYPQFILANSSKVYFMNEDSTVVQCFDYNDLLTLSAETELALTEQMQRNKQYD